MTKAEAIAAFGSVRKLADALGITEQAVHQWGDMDAQIPKLRAYEIRELLDRKPRKTKDGASA
jgi:transcriptional repressor of cell division inhibition gene dicB